MGLFDSNPPNADRAYKKMREADHPVQAMLKERLDALWDRYRPYADTHFAQEFARDLHARFWEMYLTTQLLDAGKNVRPRSASPRQAREHGPDICITEERKNIWIEAVAPDLGEPGRPDTVPGFIPLSEGGGCQNAPRREVELRITTALRKKLDAFRDYKKKGLVSEQDICIVAISCGRFFVQSHAIGLPPAVSSVYPLGPAYIRFNKNNLERASSGYFTSEEIHRTGAGPIPRLAFLDNYSSGISGLIWSRRTLGNAFFRGADLTFVHNFAASNALPTRWIPWSEEYVVHLHDNEYEVTRIEK